MGLGFFIFFLTEGIFEGSSYFEPYLSVHIPYQLQPINPMRSGFIRITTYLGSVGSL